MTLIAVILLAAPASPKDSSYFPPSDARGGWRTLANADEVRQRTAIDVGKLDEAFAYVQGTSQHGGLLVARHGYLVYEKYFGRGHREATPEMASCGKAVTSVAVGIALAGKRSLIPRGLDEKVFTPKYMPKEIFPLDDPRKAEITLGQLLAMSAGIRGTNPGFVHGQKVEFADPAKDGPIATTDEVALHQSLWTAPGQGYSYATSSSHLASIVLRRLTGMEMQRYIDENLAKPMGWGRWGYALNRPGLKMDHTPGGGSIAMRPTDALRFAYLMLHEGRWGSRQLVPADFVRACGRPSPYNPHSNHSLNFVVNEDGHVAGAPKDAYWKAGNGGHSFYVVPSLDMVIYKLGGREEQYDPALTGLPVLYKYDGSRDGWKATSGGMGTERTLELVVAAATDAPKLAKGIPTARAPYVLKSMNDLKKNTDLFADKTANYTVQYMQEEDKTQLGACEVHEGKDHVFVVIDGKGIYNVGGTLEEPREVSPGEWRGARLKDAKAFPVSKGDVIVIPRGTAHYRDSKGSALSLLSISIYSAPPAAH